MLHVICLDYTPNILSNIKRLKSALANIIEPDFGLLDELLSLEVLTLPQLADVRSERTVYRRSEALLDLLESEDQCDKILKALQRTGQQHIVNCVTQNGGQTQFIIGLTLCFKKSTILFLSYLADNEQIVITVGAQSDVNSVILLINS